MQARDRLFREVAHVTVLRAVKQRQLHIFARRGAGQQIETLKHKTDLAIANVGELIAIEARNVRVIQEILAGTRPVQATEDVHQRRFARAAGAHERDEFASFDFQRNAAHGVHVHFAGAIDLVHVNEPNERTVVHVRFINTSL